MAGYRIYHCKECHREIWVHIKDRRLVTKNRCDHIPEYLTESEIKKRMYVRKYPVELRSVSNYF